MLFTINFPPPVDKISRDHYRNYVSTECQKICHLFPGVSTTISDVQNPEDPAYNNSIIFGQKVIFHSKCDQADNGDHRAIYKELLNLWMTGICSYSPKVMPVLSVSDPAAFSENRQPFHKDFIIDNLCFGTMPFSGQFSCYVSIQNAVFRNLPNQCTTVANFCHDTRRIDITLRGGTDPLMISINYQDIRKILVSKIESSEHVHHLYLDLSNPPVLNIRKLKEATDSSTYEVSVRFLTFHRVEPSTIGKSNIILLVLRNSKEAESVISRLHYQCKKMPIGFAKVQVIKRSVPVDPQFCFPHFSANYLFQAILNRNLSVAEQLQQSHDFTHLSQPSVQVKHIERSLTEILLAIDAGQIIYFPQALPVLYESYSECISDDNALDHYTIPDKSCMVRRVVLTPTRCLLYPPEVHLSNRFLREFKSDFTLRITFRDDNMCKLNFISAFAHHDIFKFAIEKPMRDGIKVGGRHYMFLGWSNSQIRDHGAWMYAKDDKGYASSDVRRWMGNFSHIHPVSKYMARLGQCFTQTEDTLSLPLDEHYIRTEKDIHEGFDPMTGEPYCFSDGIGKISPSLAAKVCDILGRDKHCSAFQIRYGGYKGMLTIDPTLKDTDIVFRESMKKFDSPGNITLEIARTSTPTKVSLNRPLITILNQMGVRTSVFMQLQEDTLCMLTDMLMDEGKAANYLKSHVPKILKYDALASHGFGFTTEPFMRSLLLSLHKHHVEKIKKKASIIIDPNKGRNMFGVLDETCTLKYDEVFIQYTKDVSCGETTNKTDFVTGPVLVSRSVCHHPGDVRRLTAVDVPELHHIVDCVVFSQQGPRPRPNEMAGGDLDGDEYIVIWQKELIFTKDHYKPASYAKAVPVVSGHQRITEADMIQFLIHYIKHDQVGEIASAHLARADACGAGVFSSKCMRIAEMFSVAVDFAKHGTKAFLDVELKPKAFPDFMEKHWKMSYKSDKVLGKMFRVCKDFESARQYANNIYTNVQFDEELIYPGWEVYEEQAIKSKDKYNRLLYSILETYGIAHESEAFAGVFPNFLGRYNERRYRNDIDRLIIKRLKTLCANMKREFLAEFQSDLENFDSRLLQKASAWYMVTYREPQAIYLSFPWIVSEYLANIKTRQRKNFSPEGPLSSPVVEKMNEMISCCITSNKVPPLSREVISTLEDYTFCCEREIIEQSLRLLIYWAMTMNIIQKPEQAETGFMHLQMFLDLFLHVAAQMQYIEVPRVSTMAKVKFCSASLCLEFFKFCIKLRFREKNEVKRMLSFDVYKYKQLAKHAMFTYHEIAIFGSFHLLEHGSESVQESVETTLCIENGRYKVIAPEILKNAEKILMEKSDVEHLTLRTVDSIKKVLISACGSSSSIKKLEHLIRKVDPLLLFSEDNMALLEFLFM